ncbi:MULTISPECIES: DsbA family oxidoreductase [unclassified Microbacterium]|uniref:DsbA family oxidoreductase n=1 Tax=unclassified Microbacterium TaxID=2609290 RepID=UPI00097EF0AC|nr:DsbA family oxidoreductase [Microbacterium sp. JB110]SJM46413.1 2-hydroxychromene-2-carboxylate isomerase/DsbA-like thioredoxin domain [Frigoribacterium sp. JB110]
MTDTSTAPARLGIDVWLDVACPWCALGERRLRSVISDLPFTGEVDVRFHSYQLDPNAPERATMSQAEYLAGRGLDPERLEASHRHLSDAGEQVGFRFDHAATVPSNTFTAHRMIQAATAHGVQAAVVDALLVGYFQNGVDVGDAAALREVVVSAGLDPVTADEVLADPAAYADDVRGDIAQASSLGIQGVPFYVLDGRYGISGAQPAEVFEQALTQVYDELNPKPAQPLNLVGEQGTACGPDGCEA